MNFKNFLIIFVFLIFVSCKNPYLKDPKFNPEESKFNVLPVNESDVKWMQPYGYVVYDSTRSANHIGFDFGMKSSGLPFYSCGEGIVVTVDYNTGQGLPGTNYRIIIQTSYRICLEYHFEIGGTVSEEERKKNIFVKQGDYIKAGDKIANLISLTDGAHVDFGIKMDDKRDKCPLYFFTIDAAEKLETLFDSIEKRPIRNNLCE